MIQQADVFLLSVGCGSVGVGTGSWDPGGMYLIDSIGNILEQIRVRECGMVRLEVWCWACHG